jgi:DNA mismatch repair protein MutS
VSDPAESKGIVDRAVTRIVTAGTIFEDDLLDQRAHNFLIAVFPAGRTAGLAWLDVSTGAFTVSMVPRERLADELSRLEPSEVLLPESVLRESGELVDDIARVCPAPRVSGPEWTFEHGNAHQTLREVLGVATLAGFGIDEASPCVNAAGAALAYVQHTQRGAFPPVSEIKMHDGKTRAGLDRATRSCLELLATQRGGKREGSLLSVLDATATSMGARLLRDWIVMPLVDPEAIRWRQSAVAELVEKRDVCDDVAELLARVPDIERIATRLLAGRGSPRDISSLRSALRVVPKLASPLAGCASAPLASAAETLEPLPELLLMLERGLAEHPAATLGDGGLIASGWNPDLDQLRDLRENGAAAIASFQAAEAERLGIPALKVAFNKVFGYFVEITHAQAAQAQIPDHYVRKQTLTSAERYITPELKELESSILTAEEKSKRLEIELFQELRDAAAREGEAVRRLAGAMAQLDVLVGFAQLARERGWIRPDVDDGPRIDIEEGRHPVLDALLPTGELVPNDVLLDQQGGRLVLITGPNMAGKSTYIRQTAVLVLMAQIGSFLPARKATVGVVDRIFTRLGAADDLSAGASTFMVEMTETAAILNGATDRSLVILDEVGRGTSTWDGLSLAWSISEYLYKNIGARTLFATHYHELVDLADEFDGVRNVNVAVKEWGDSIVFQHKIIPGGTDRSYGLHVARLAGVPNAVIERARHVLRDLEHSAPDLRPGATSAAPEVEPAVDTRQKALFGRPVAAVVDEIRSLDVDQVTPVDALLMLKRFAERLGDGAPPTESGEAEG